MKKYLLALAILVGFNGVISAQFKLPSIPSNPLSSDKSEPSGDVNASQEALMSRVADAIGDTLAAQALIAEAQGKAELAATLNNTSSKLKGGDPSNDDIKGAVLLTKDTAAEQKEVFSNGEAMSGGSKALYGKALLPYIKAVAKTTKLKDPISNFMKDAQSTLKTTRNPMKLTKLKKTLDTGLFVGKNVPKLIVSLATSAKDLMSFAKKNDLDTSGADDIEL